MAEAENTAENLSTALAEISIKAGKAIKRASILAEQLEKTFLSLVIIREEKVIMAPKNECAIYYLVTLSTKDNTT